MASSIPAFAPTEARTLPGVAVQPRGRRAAWLALAGATFVFLLGLVAVAAPSLAPHDPVRQSLHARLAPPTLAGSDGQAHLLGLVADLDVGERALQLGRGEQVAARAAA